MRFTATISVFLIALVASPAMATDALFLDGDIALALQGDGTVEVSWQTLAPTQRGELFAGEVPGDSPLAEPVYASMGTFDLPEPATSHLMTFSLSALDIPGSQLFSQGHSTVHIRLAIVDPETTRTRYFHTRFACVYISGEWQRLPCIMTGPTVDLVGEHEFTVSFTLDQPAAVDLYYQMRGYNFGVLLSEATSFSRRIRYLFSDEEVLYQIRPRTPLLSSPPPGRTYSVRTAPPIGGPQPFRFILMSDSRSRTTSDPLTDVERVNWAVLQELMRMSHDLDPSLIIFAGDLVTGYTNLREDFERQLVSWQRATDPVAALIPVWEGMGNHEAIGPGDFIKYSFADENAPEVIFSEHFVNPTNGPDAEAPEAPPYGETVYSFDWGNCHFAMVNSNYWWKLIEPDTVDIPGNREGFVMPRQMQWLDDDLELARLRGQTHLFVITHEPAFPNGGHVRDAMYWNGLYPDVLAMRDEFSEILSRHGVLALLNGDEHNYSRMVVDGAVCPTVQHPFWQIVSGGAGAPTYPQQTVPWTDRVDTFARRHHFVLFEVDGDSVTLSAIDIDGQTFDTVDLIEELGNVEQMPQGFMVTQH